MKVIRDIWVCQDCLMAAVNGDSSGLDYAYEPDEAERRMEEIVAGIEALPGLVDDSSEEEQRECRDCGYIHSADHFKEVCESTDPTDPDWVETFFECPECHSHDTVVRDSGTDEFSWRQCDCCGSTLGGSRHRMAQLIHEETT